MVLIVTVEFCGLPLRLTVDGSSEQEAYVPGVTGAHVSATGAVKPLMGVTSSAYVAGEPGCTVADADEPPPTVSVKLPAPAPLPVSGMTAGDCGSELTIVSRWPPQRDADDCK